MMSSTTPLTSSVHVITAALVGKDTLSRPTKYDYLTITFLTKQQGLEPNANLGQSISIAIWLQKTRRGK